MNSARPDVVLVGGFQCGKSTLFDAILDGREISPRGRGVRTSACAITATSIPQGNREWVEICWRSSQELDAIAAKYAECDLTDCNKADLRRYAFVAEKFNHTKELTDWRSRKKIDFKLARRIVAYPKGWESDWINETDVPFALEDVLFVFVERIVYHIHSTALETLGCSLTDSPGFGIGVIDDVLSKEAALSADLILCVIDGGQKSITETYREYLSWLMDIHLDKRLLLAVNSFTSRERALELNYVSEAQLSQQGFMCDKGETMVVNALMAYGGRTKSHLKSKSMISATNRSVARYLSLDPIDDREKLDSYIKDPELMFEASDVDDLLLQISGRLKRINEIADPPIVTRKQGVYTFLPGYYWADDISLISRMQNGVAWTAGIPHPDKEHVVSMIEEGVWGPEVGYGWAENNPDSGWVTWCPGFLHPQLKNVKASETPNKWIPCSGYVWGDGTNDGRMNPESVMWKPAMKHHVGAHFVSGTVEGEWIPEFGYDWVDRSSVEAEISHGVRWIEGMRHPTIQHVFTDKEEGRFRKDEGYRWRDPNNAFEGVMWCPRMRHPANRDMVASSTEGEWVKISDPVSTLSPKELLLRFLWNALS